MESSLNKKDYKTDVLTITGGDLTIDVWTEKLVFFEHLLQCNSSEDIPNSASRESQIEIGFDIGLISNDM